MSRNSGSGSVCTCGVTRVLLLPYIYIPKSLRNFVYSKDLERSCEQYSVTNNIVGVMFLPSIFENRCVDFRRSMYRPSKIDDRCHDVSTFEDRCVDLRRSMCRPSEIDVLTFEDQDR